MSRFPWLAGWHPARPDARLDVVPRGGRRIPGCGPHAWSWGYEDRHVRTARTDDGLSMTVVGACPVTGDDLQRALRAARAGRLSDISPGFGSYTAIVRRPAVGGDQRRFETLVFGDLGGASRVHTVPYQGGIMWATSASALAALVGDCPDSVRLVLDIVARGIDPGGGLAPFPRIDGVDPGALLWLGPEGAARQRWHVPGKPLTLELAGPRFAGTLREAVARRCALYLRLAAEFSSGVDSSAIMALAAQGVRAGAELTSITHIGDRSEQDLELVRQVLDEYRHVGGEFVDDDPSGSYFADLDRPDLLPATDLPCRGLAIIGPMRARLRRASAHQVTGYFSGMAGDDMLSVSRHLPATLAAGGRRAAIMPAIRLASSTEAGTLVALAALLRRRPTSLQRSLRATARVIRRGGLDPANGRDTFCAELDPVFATRGSGWLRPEWAEPVADWFKVQARAIAPDCDPEAAYTWHGIRHTVAIAAGGRNLAAGMGMDLLMPYVDDALLGLREAVGLGLEPPGTFKPMVTQWMQGQLPQAITGRRGKDDLSVNKAHWMGLDHNVDALWNLFARAALIEPGIFGPPIFDRAAVTASVELLVSRREMLDWPMLGFLGVSAYLDALDLRREIWWEERR